MGKSAFQGQNPAAVSALLLFCSFCLDCRCTKAGKWITNDLLLAPSGKDIMHFPSVPLTPELGKRYGSEAPTSKDNAHIISWVNSGQMTHLRPKQFSYLIFFSLFLKLIYKNVSYATPRVDHLLINEVLGPPNNTFSRCEKILYVFLCECKILLAIIGK